MTDNHGQTFLAVQTAEQQLVSLTAQYPALQDFKDLVRLARSLGEGTDDLASRLADASKTPGSSLAALQDAGWQLTLPLLPPEIWAAGVTYEISRQERQRESQLPDVYARVYGAERPEIFLKATPDRCVGPGDAIGVRADSAWNVPEPELALVLDQGQISGFTIGNDVSSRSIEGENPLYLPQAKVYDRCCSLGPCVVSAESLADPQQLQIECQIIRDGARIFQGSASTAQMVRRFEELTGFLLKHNRVPDGTVLLTGTAIVPPEEITLSAGDLVRIEIDPIGTLENPVIVV